MTANSSVIKPTGLVHGHTEVRFLDDTIPVLTQVSSARSDRAPRS